MSNSLEILPILLHVPHASKHIPTSLREQFTISDKELELEINKLTDHFTDWLIAPLSVPAENQVVSPISRLVVDMERFADDSLESMSQIGMGVIYEKGSQLQNIRRQLTKPEKASLISNYYNRHHQILTTQTASMLQRYQQAIIIDVHSYPKTTLPYERDPQQPRPEICIGTCDYHTPIELESALVNSFRSEGFEVGLNTPFAGTLIPTEFWQKDQRVFGFMIEVRRDVYMNETSFTLLDNGDVVRNKICNAIKTALKAFLS
ncbi:MAG: N-formylglutamate deformylase [Glaciecola sp.]|jgi:N-formylglutamate deformylase